MIRGVVFDFDHTLVHSPLDFAAMRRGIYAELDAIGWPDDGRDGKLMLELVEAAVATLDEDLGGPLRERCLAGILAIELRAAAEARVIDGVVEMLARLRSEGRSPAVITRNCRAVVETVLGHWPLDCGPVLCRDDVPRVKPHPDHALAALARLAVEPHEALMVGDFTADMVCAREAGMPAVGVTTGGSTAEALREAGAVAVLGSVAELPDWLTAQGW